MVIVQKYLIRILPENYYSLFVNSEVFAKRKEIKISPEFADFEKGKSENSLFWPN